MYAKAPFHTIVNLSNWKVVFLCTVMYMVAWMGFAIIYWLISRSEDGQCDLVRDYPTATAGSSSKGELQSLSLVEAFFFSVETMATIGYGAPVSCPPGVPICCVMAQTGR